MLAGIGIVIATASAVALAPVVQPLLFHVSARSVVVYGLVAGVVLTIAVAASLIPAMRAARVSPMVAIRSE